ncbi:Zn-dependent hydrolase [Aliidiomarina minuta]|uniref:Zn-dependent hydrolase n=1 Tax=Aliidiomarina minuta TaxID=880057 RepID=A0A432W7C1_9GAMM|nr:MBL fold metallo-hydrolase [Aliidiomarina minuta]RUO25980.1 Zn-dependent hydrolase [Aliidiomarina minuta]
MNHPSICLLLISCSLLVACSSNDVTRIEAEQAGATQTDQGRYRNAYRDIEYPDNCEADCYLPHPLVECQQPGENCQYTGDNPTTNLNAGFEITWLGHASFKIQSPDGQQLLFDPVSQQFDWPVNWAFRLSDGFNRNTPQWPDSEQLQDTAGVFYSHLHYDHFNKADVRRIGTEAEFFVPLDMASNLPRGGYRITEMDWYTQTSLGPLTVHAVPAHHFNSRVWVPFLYEDENRALWSGWIIEYEGKKLFFAGDTGYSPHFKDIQQRYGDMDICLLPIASYHHEEHGNWYRYVHTTPEDTLAAAEDLQCKSIIPWGYGNASWKMGDHSSHSALIRLLNVYPDSSRQIPLLILNEGETVKL